MVRADDVVFHDERARLYDVFMSDVVAIGGDIASVSEIGCSLRFALESDCDPQQWSALDYQLASLLARAARQPYHPGVSRLFSYLRENRYGA